MAATLAGCKSSAPQLPAVISPYKIDIQQGNVVTQEMVAKLKAGMTPSQVRFVLGSPLVIDPFHADRWDYVFLYRKQGQSEERRRLTVIFLNDKLASIEGDVVLTESELEVQKPAPPPGLRPNPAPVKPEAKPPVAATPAPKPAATKPAEKSAVAATSAPKPAGTPPVASAPALQPPASTVASAPVVKPDVTAPPERKGEAPRPETPKSEAKSGIAPPEGPQAGKAKADATVATADDKKETQKEKGFFGRILDKIGY